MYIMPDRAILCRLDISERSLNLLNMKLALSKGQFLNPFNVFYGICGINLQARIEYLSVATISLMNILAHWGVSADLVQFSTLVAFVLLIFRWEE